MDIRICFGVLSLSFFQSCIFATKRVFPLYLKKGISLTNPYASVVFKDLNLVKCGILCKADNRCTASSLSQNGFTCALYDTSSVMEIIDSGAVLMYQNEGWKVYRYLLYTYI